MAKEAKKSLEFVENIKYLTLIPSFFMRQTISRGRICYKQLSPSLALRQSPSNK